MECHHRSRGMSRWPTDARQRLERAAIDLFVEQGFAATTVPQIAGRAGLTTRTFFRHFADKREVIFAGDEIPTYARQLIADAPPELAPLALIVAGLRTVAESRFEGRRADVAMLRRLIASDASLRERDLRKRADLAEAVRTGLTARGVAPTQAALLAETTVAVLHLSIDEWLDHDDDQPLYGLILQNLAALHSELAVISTET